MGIGKRVSVKAVLQDAISRTGDQLAAVSTDDEGVFLF
jgi:hypothetical protein